MLCNRCGIAVGSAATRCIHCGAELSGADLVEPPSLDPQAEVGMPMPALTMARPSAWALRLAGFIVGICTTFFLEYLIFLLIQEASGQRLLPRGRLLVVFPIVAGVILGRYTPYFVESRLKEQGSLRETFWTASAATRFVIVAPFFWAICVITYIFLFEPYGYQISEREYIQTAKIIAFPSAILICGYVLFNKLIRSR
jgi:hypothetical protein